MSPDKFMLKYETQDKTNEHTFKTQRELEEFAAGLLFMPVQSIRKHWWVETTQEWLQYEFAKEDKL